MWQPIETAPKDHRTVIVMHKHVDTMIVNAAFWCEDADEPEDTGWWSYEHSEVSRTMLCDWMAPTHWMPLPEYPTTEGAK